MQSAVHFFSTETVTYGVDKLQDPHQFETEFARILGGLKNPRLLVIFDNLDRVAHDKALEVLSTIKTFWSQKILRIRKRKSSSWFLVMRGPLKATWLTYINLMEKKLLLALTNF